MSAEGLLGMDHYASAARMLSLPTMHTYLKIYFSHNKPDAVMLKL
jgi:hypothetical protein